ncbi:MAG TPA: c-type cytochrome [Longimicrobiales bacterium]
MNAIQLVCFVVLMLAPQDQEAGKAIFQGKGNCYACHGPTGRGTGMAPNLADTTWLNIDGSREQIVALVKTGVPRPKRYPMAMPAMGGAMLSAGEIDAVARYVVSLRSSTDDDAAEHGHRAAADTALDMAGPGGHMCRGRMGMHALQGGSGRAMMRANLPADSAQRRTMGCPRCGRARP